MINLILNAFLGISIALLPLYLRVADADTSRPSKNFLFLTIIIIFAMLAEKKREVPFYFKLVAGYGLLAIVVNQHDVLSANVASQMVYISLGILFFIKYFECYEKQTIQCLFDGMIVGSLIQGALSLGGYFGHEWYYDFLVLLHPSTALDITHAAKGSGNVVGSLDNLNLLASYLCLTIPAFFSREKILPLILIPFTALILSGSAMGIGALFAGIAYWACKKKQIYLYAMAAMIALPFFNIGMDSGRFEGWRANLSNLPLSHWIFGGGAGWFPDQQFKILDGTIMSSEHNSFLAIFNVYGLIGFVLLAPIFWKFLKAKDHNPLVSTMVFIAFCNSYGHFTLHQSTVVIIIIPILCIALDIDRKTKLPIIN